MACGVLRMQCVCGGWGVCVCVCVGGLVVRWGAVLAVQFACRAAPCLQDDGTTALMLAAEGGHDAVVELLLAQGADVLHADVSGGRCVV